MIYHKNKVLVSLVVLGVVSLKTAAPTPLKPTQA